MRRNNLSVGDNLEFPGHRACTVLCSFPELTLRDAEFDRPKNYGV